MSELEEKQLDNCFRNKNGNYTIEEWTELIEDNKFDEYCRKFNTTNNKCPPSIFCINSNCFRCYDCHINAYHRIVKGDE